MAKTRDIIVKRTRNWSLAQKFAHYSKRGRQVPGVEGRCLEWTGYTDENGYGVLYWRGEYYRAHRLRWMKDNGEPTPERPHILHHCDNPSCMRRKHLHDGTHSDNMQERWDRGRINLSGERNGRAKLTAGQVAEIRLAVGSQQSIADRYGVNQQTISRIKRGTGWKEG